MSEHYYCPRCNKEYDEDDKKLVCSECGYELAADQLDKNMTKLIYKYYNAAMPGKTSSNTAATANSATTKKSSNTKNASASAASNTASKTASSSTNSYANQNKTKTKTKTKTQTTSSSYSYSSSSGLSKEAIIVAIIIIGILAVVVICPDNGRNLRVKKSKANDTTAVIQQVETETQETEKTQKKQQEQNETQQTEKKEKKQKSKTDKKGCQVGTIGEGGGVIFYDKGEYSDGWRYLEVSMDDTPFSTWGTMKIKKDALNKTFDDETLGTGYQQTEFLVSLNDWDEDNPAVDAVDYGFAEDCYLGNSVEMRLLFAVINDKSDFFYKDEEKNISDARKYFKQRIGKIKNFEMPQGDKYWMLPSIVDYHNGFDECSVSLRYYDTAEDKVESIDYFFKKTNKVIKITDTTEAYVRPIRRY